MFTKNFISVIKQSTSYNELKDDLEKLDTFNLGLIEKIQFCKIIRKYSTEYNDEDIMKFIRISSLSHDGKVKYPEFLDLIFYENYSKEAKFNDILEILKQEFLSCNKDMNVLFLKIAGKDFKQSIGNVYIPQNDIKLSIEDVYVFLKNKCKSNIDKNAVCKLDLDQDGKINFSDFKGDFKYEIFSKFEELYRNLNGIKKISFTNYKLNGNHLQLLSAFIQWVKPSRLKLVFKNNELNN